MNLPVTLALNQEVVKRLFRLKPQRQDGLLLKVHHSTGNKRVRFVHVCFHDLEQIIVSADNEGNFYVVDYTSCKFWGLPKLDSCTIIKFSSYIPNELLVGRNNGDILIINIDSGHAVGKLQGHKMRVENVSFAKQKYCLSVSQRESIVWDLETNSKIQVLNLEKNNILKHVAFIPVSSNILACFQDDLIQVWNFKKFETIKQFLPINWKNYSVKSIAFTKNGQYMVVAGYLPTLAIFDLNSWKVIKMISLPDYIHTIKFVEFLPRPFDGGFNKLLSILSGQGVIYFYDIDQNVITSELSSKTEINKIAFSPDGNYLACLLCSGELELYNIKQYVAPPVDVRVQKVQRKVKLPRKGYSREIEVVKQRIDDVLETEKLKAILKEYGEYPEAHRMKIWERLLQLPNNIQQYNSIINHVTLVAFQDLYSKYPLESKLSIKDLKKLLNNLVTWCPFFASVEYLPVFAYPFVKVFQNKPVACFEAICTIILNWCQHWFEYFPLPPVNILAIIENVLIEHDPELLHHFASKNVTSNTYFWPLLETAFSEVLTSSEWLQFWDHVLTNEISFLLFATAAYSITQRHTLLSLNNLDEFEFFFHNQNPNDMKKLLKTTYCLLNTTSEKLHPRQYLDKFNSIEKGNYPLFIEYPKTIVDFQREKTNEVQEYLNDLEGEDSAMVGRAREESLRKIDAELHQEQSRRLREMEKVCFDKLKSKLDVLRQKQKDLDAKRTILFGSESRNFIQVQGQEVINEAGNPASSEDSFNGETADDKEHYLKQLKRLLQYKYMIEEGLDKDSEKNISGRKYQQQIDSEIEKIRRSLGSLRDLKKLNIAASLDVIDKFIGSIKREISQSESGVAHGNKASSIHSATRALEKEVSKLLLLVKSNKDLKTRRSRHDSNKKTICICEDVCQKTVRFSESTGS